ncbi:YslB family protein [Oenococcus oeni]|uniref:YslB family protein n=2 Tax=Oenococcus oeni TaxID=1247 RepID=UPI000277B432|nr:YslB family protein [Oenococcus oeni]EJO05792.1 hydrocarbon binding protein [Oenococcus oeni AWRIB422]EJO07452.1 hydrocarbon binding protein [Oenococcus oeni AWRIB548]KEP86874.1 hydrocarbon binding protein [Oenococcus oeni IOEB_0205]KGH68292.1 hydrocarbon-binding protein [Oenococcus oeni IOEB_B16]OIL82724.1 hydrocarbon-binding protein [Oenococcus oeni]
MKKDAYKNLSKFSNNQTAFSLALLRDGILNDILDDDANDILYYAGKEVARQFYTKTLNGIQEFFLAAGWGDIQISSQKENKESWLLTGEAIKIRSAAIDEPSYFLEAGFLAQEIQQQTHRGTECSYQSDDKSRVIFTVYID